MNGSQRPVGALPRQKMRTRVAIPRSEMIEGIRTMHRVEAVDVADTQSSALTLTSGDVTATTKTASLSSNIIEGDSTITTTPTVELTKWSSRRDGIKDEKSKHIGQWQKKEYSLGRYSRGGFWSCCGEREQIAFPCNTAMRERWRRSQVETDSDEAKRVVRRAMAANARIVWEMEGKKKWHESIQRNAW